MNGERHRQAIKIVSQKFFLARKELRKTCGMETSKRLLKFYFAAVEVVPTIPMICPDADMLYTTPGVVRFNCGTENVADLQISECRVTTYFNNF